MSLRRPILPTRLYPMFLCLLLGMGLPPVLADDKTDPYYDWRDEVGRGEYDYDDSQDIPWIENETEVLALPQADDLSRVRLDSLPPGVELLVDRRRITVGEKDRVVRLWLWTRSRAGAESGSFEGYRCETREYKVYAYANPRRDPPVRLAPRARWSPLLGSKSGNFRLELLEDYFCGIRGTRSAREIADRLHGGFERERFMSQ